MTEQEAKLVLVSNEENSIEDVFEDELFQLKQSFLSSLPTSKLFKSKFKKITRLSDAYSALGGAQQSIIEVEQVPFDYSSNSVREVLTSFQENDSKIKLLLLSSSSTSAVIDLGAQLVGNYKAFASKWRLTTLPIEQEVRMSDIPDPMTLIQAVNEFNESGKQSFYEIKTLKNDNLLKKEAIRLTLWLNFEANV